MVQEALTNVTKHAGVRVAEVRVEYTRDRLTVTVANGGRAGPLSGSPQDSGYGVMGMRERARSVGGHVRVGPRTTGGFEVVAELPLDADQLARSPAD
ncbi:ATP-binding protein [Streptomyces sp. NPDC088794]|uniref:ATP-binding protein n=1 Tax=Streptomyces sp. NPDC088794 TaxID=3365902 RepID=UPI00380D833E